MRNPSARSGWLIVLVHIVCWAVFLSLPAIFNPRRQNEGVMKYIHDLAETPRWTNAVFLVVLFYFNYLFAVPRLYFRRRYLQFVVTAVLAFAAFVLLNSFQRPHFYGGPWFSPLGHSFNLFMYLIVYLVSFVLCLAQMWQHLREHSLRAQLHALRGQMDPHLLFNTLNNIYALSLAGSEAVPRAVVKLSDVLRYTTADDTAQLVPLHKEVRFLQDYIELEQLRLPGDVTITLSGHEDLPGIEIPRFIFLPLLSAIFASANNGEDPARINISFSRADNEVIASFSLAPVQPHSAAAARLAHASAQVRQRIVLPGSSDYRLFVSNNDHIFVMTLQIRLS